jgi:hypothetical protein
MVGSIALGLAVATGMWNGAPPPQAIVCNRPIDARCFRRLKRARFEDRSLQKWKRHRRARIAGWEGWLSSTSTCESHGNYRINTHNGYYGGLQFSLSTWQSVGGIGYPHRNPKLEQQYRGVVLAETGGTGHWPVCG